MNDILHRMPWQTVIMMMNDKGKTGKRKENDSKVLTNENDVNDFMSSVKNYRVS